MANNQRIAEQAFIYIKNGVKIALAFIPGAPLATKLIEPVLELVFKHLQWGGVFTEALSAEQSMQLRTAVKKAFQDVCLTLPKNKRQLLSRAWPSLEGSMQELIILNDASLKASVKAILECPSVRESEFLTEGEFDALSFFFVEALEANLDNTKLADSLNRKRIKDIYKVIYDIMKQSADQGRLLDDYGFRIGLLESRLAPILSVDLAVVRERSRELLNKQMRYRYYYHNDEVDYSILPPLQRDCELAGGEMLTLSAYLKRMRQTNIRATQILGEGGMGKSSSLLALWNELNVGMDEVPLMVPLHEANLCPKEQADTFIIRYLCENYFFQFSDATLQSQSNHIKGLFSRKTERPEYLLLLDGFNEVADTFKFSVARQVVELLGFCNISLIIASRQNIGGYLSMSDIHSVTLHPLQTSTIHAYIRSFGQNPDETESFRDLLKTPMLLTVYCETTKIVSSTRGSDLFRYLEFDTNVHKKGELISNYMESLAAKRFLDASKNEEEPHIALAQQLWMDYFVLPEIAWSMVQHQFFQWSKTKTLLDGLKNINISSAETRDWFSDRSLLNAWTVVQEKISPPNQRDTMPENILAYLESWPTIFVKRKHWEFIHQDYRDFCAARFVVQQLDNSDDWDQHIPADVHTFVGDIYNAYTQ